MSDVMEETVEAKDALEQTCKRLGLEFMPILESAIEVSENEGVAPRIIMWSTVGILLHDSHSANRLLSRKEMLDE